MQLRRATPDDYERAGEVTVAAYADFTLGPADPYVARLRDAATRDREAELWVATPEGRDEILGCVTLCPPDSPWRELSGPDEGEFRMLAVAPEARGRGVGEALARMCLDRFRREGRRGVVICSLPEMKDAHRLYERLGFRRAPELDWSPLDGVRLHGYRNDFEENPLTDMNATLTFTVTESDTAVAVGSGSLPALATPRLLAWCEAATCAAIDPSLAEGSTSVGTRVTLDHQGASGVGEQVEVTASPAFVDGRLHRFTVAARHVNDRKVVATGEITRVVLDVDKFLSRL